ncbi:MAG: hypothetical protein ACOH2H_22170 [Cypionkella sp.]
MSLGGASARRQVSGETLRHDSLDDFSTPQNIVQEDRCSVENSIVARPTDLGPASAERPTGRFACTINQ